MNIEKKIWYLRLKTVKIIRLLKLPAVFLFYDAHADLKMQVFFFNHYSQSALIFQFELFPFQDLYIDHACSSSLVIYTTSPWLYPTIKIVEYALLLYSCLGNQVWKEGVSSSYLIFLLHEHMKAGSTPGAFVGLCLTRGQLGSALRLPEDPLCS